MDKLLKVGSTEGKVFAESDLFKDKDYVTLDVPILNVAFSGKLEGGLVPGLTILAGDSKTYKSLLALRAMKAYLDKYKDGIAVFYDSEFGISKEYLVSLGIDPNRVIHIPVYNVEVLKFDMTKKLEEIKKGDRVFFLVDSIGQISSKKEVDDAHDEKAVADMTRAKSIRSLLRLVTVQLAMKNLPCIMIAHIYRTMELYSKVVVGGGTAVTYAANQIFVVTKSQEKGKDGEIEGWNFNINIEKSRFVKERSKLSFQVMYDEGIQKYSGILDLALENGDIIKPKNGWYQLVDKDTGEILGKSYRQAETNCEEVLGVVLKRKDFQQFVMNKYMLAAPQDHDELVSEMDEYESEDNE